MAPSSGIIIKYNFITNLNENTLLAKNLKPMLKK